MRILPLLLSSLFFLILVGDVKSQFNITNLMEAQLGKLPNENVAIFPSVYDRLEIDYRKKGFSISSTIEQYHTTFEGRGYIDLSQLSLGYKKKGWDIKLGNFYETLGRGLLLRSFEFPGAILEDVGFRSRTYFHRDMLGASVKYRTKKASFQLLHVDALNNVFPPTFSRDERRIDNITAGVANWKYIKGHEVGLIFMRHDDSNGNIDNYVSGSLRGNIVRGLGYYFEYAKDINENNYAFYGGLTGFKGNFSYAIEYRNYDNFSLGAGINEPPAAVKQQTYRVLNRSIHVSDPFNESGFQIDLFYNFKDGTVLNLNHSLARNDFGAIVSTFRQYFLEIQSSIGSDIEYKAFVDYSKDPFKREDDRYSVGLYTDIGVKGNVRILPEFEYQYIDRNGEGLYNVNFQLGVGIGAKLFLSVLAELTDDPFIIEEGSTTRLYLGNTIRYKPNFNDTFQFFFGQRRGGPACSAGVCYEILDFRGMEVRWVKKFRI